MIWMCDHQLNLAAERMGSELVSLEEVLRSPWSGWVKGYNIPVTVRPSRSFCAASREPYSRAAGRHYFIDEAKNLVNGLGREWRCNHLCSAARERSRKNSQTTVGQTLPDF